MKPEAFRVGAPDDRDGELDLLKKPPFQKLLFGDTPGEKARRFAAVEMTKDKAGQ